MRKYNKLSTSGADNNCLLHSIAISLVLQYLYGDKEKFKYFRQDDLLQLFNYVYSEAKEQESLAKKRKRAIDSQPQENINSIVDLVNVENFERIVGQALRMQLPTILKDNARYFSEGILQQWSSEKIRELTKRLREKDPGCKTVHYLEQEQDSIKENLLLLCLMDFECAILESNSGPKSFLFRAHKANTYTSKINAFYQYLWNHGPDVAEDERRLAVALEYLYDWWNGAGKGYQFYQSWCKSGGIKIIYPYAKDEFAKWQRCSEKGDVLFAWDESTSTWKASIVKATVLRTYGEDDGEGKVVELMQITPALDQLLKGVTKENVTEFDTSLIAIELAKNSSFEDKGYMYAAEADISGYASFEKWWEEIAYPSYADAMGYPETPGQRPEMLGGIEAKALAAQFNFKFEYINDKFGKIVQGGFDHGDVVTVRAHYDGTAHWSALVDAEYVAKWNAEHPSSRLEIKNTVELPAPDAVGIVVAPESLVEAAKSAPQLAESASRYADSSNHFAPRDSLISDQQDLEETIPLLQDDTLFIPMVTDFQAVANELAQTHPHQFGGIEIIANDNDVRSYEARFANRKNERVERKPLALTEAHQNIQSQPVSYLGHAKTQQQAFYDAALSSYVDHLAYAKLYRSEEDIAKYGVSITVENYFGNLSRSGMVKILKSVGFTKVQFASDNVFQKAADAAREFFSSLAHGVRSLFSSQEPAKKKARRDSVLDMEYFSEEEAPLMAHDFSPDYEGEQGITGVRFAPEKQTNTSYAPLPLEVKQSNTSPMDAASVQSSVPAVSAAPANSASDDHANSEQADAVVPAAASVNVSASPAQAIIAPETQPLDVASSLAVQSDITSTASAEIASFNPIETITVVPANAVSTDAAAAVPSDTTVPMTKFTDANAILNEAPTPPALAELLQTAIATNRQAFDQGKNSAPEMRQEQLRELKAQVGFMRHCSVGVRNKKDLPPAFHEIKKLHHDILREQFENEIVKAGISQKDKSKRKDELLEKQFSVVCEIVQQVVAIPANVKSADLMELHKQLVMVKEALEAGYINKNVLVRAAKKEKYHKRLSNIDTALKILEIAADFHAYQNEPTSAALHEKCSRHLVDYFNAPFKASDEKFRKPWSLLCNTLQDQLRNFTAIGEIHDDDDPLAQSRQLSRHDTLREKIFTLLEEAEVSQQNLGTLQEQLNAVHKDMANKADTTPVYRGIGQPPKVATHELAAHQAKAQQLEKEVLKQQAQLVNVHQELTEARQELQPLQFNSALRLTIAAADPDDARTDITINLATPEALTQKDYKLLAALIRQQEVVAYTEAVASATKQANDIIAKAHERATGKGTEEAKQIIDNAQAEAKLVIESAEYYALHDLNIEKSIKTAKKRPDGTLFKKPDAIYTVTLDGQQYQVILAQAIKRVDSTHYAVKGKTLGSGNFGSVDTADLVLEFDENANLFPVGKAGLARKKVVGESEENVTHERDVWAQAYPGKLLTAVYKGFSASRKQEFYTFYMPRLMGEKLEDQIPELNSNDKFDLALALVDRFAQIGFVHGDLAARNVMVNKENGKWEVYPYDFGRALLDSDFDFASPSHPHIKNMALLGTSFPTGIMTTELFAAMGSHQPHACTKHILKRSDFFAFKGLLIYLFTGVNVESRRREKKQWDDKFNLDFLTDRKLQEALSNMQDATDYAGIRQWLLKHEDLLIGLCESPAQRAQAVAYGMLPAQSVQTAEAANNLQDTVTRENSSADVSELALATQTCESAQEPVTELEAAVPAAQDRQAALAENNLQNTHAVPDGSAETVSAPQSFYSSMPVASASQDSYASMPCAELVTATHDHYSAMPVELVTVAPTQQDGYEPMPTTLPATSTQRYSYAADLVPVEAVSSTASSRADSPKLSDAKVGDSVSASASDEETAATNSEGQKPKTIIETIKNIPNANPAAIGQWIDIIEKQYASLPLSQLKELQGAAKEVHNLVKSMKNASSRAIPVDSPLAQASQGLVKRVVQLQQLIQQQYENLERAEEVESLNNIFNRSN